MDSPPLIVLAVDGLRADALGCYGNTVFPTPAFDLLASDSIVFDHTLAEVFDRQTLYERLLGNNKQTTEQGFTREQSVLITDESLGEVADAFQESIVLELPTPDSLAATVDDTLLAQTFSQVLDQLERLFRQEEPPTLVWIHIGALLTTWDAPRDLVEALLDEEDPDPEETVVPVQGSIDREAEVDQAFTASCRYAAQIQILDACLDALQAFVGRLIGENSYHLAVMGLRGYALGEHGTLGCVDSLYAEMRDIPLLIRDATTATRRPPPRRSSAQKTTTQTGSLLAALLRGEQALGSFVAADPEMAVLASSDSLAYCTPEWRLLRPAELASVVPEAFDVNEASCQLFSKPDDRWDQNDVASLCPQIVAELINASNERLASQD